MMQQLIMVLDPKLELISLNDSVYVKLTGCNTVKFEYFYIL